MNALSPTDLAMTIHAPPTAASEGEKSKSSVRQNNSNPLAALQATHDARDRADEQKRQVTIRIAADNVEIIK